MYADWYQSKFNRKINCCHVLPVSHCLKGHPESGKVWMHFINNIIIDQMGFETTTHDCCIYKKVIDGSLVYLLQQIDDCTIACHDQRTDENAFNIIGTKMRFKEKMIIPF